jgi:hypothetical protein
MMIMTPVIDCDTAAMFSRYLSRAPHETSYNNVLITSPLLGTGLLYGSYIRSHKLRGRSADSWVQMTANAAGTGLKCLPKYEARDNQFLVIHPKTDPRYLATAIALA